VRLQRSNSKRRHSVTKPGYVKDSLFESQNKKKLLRSFSLQQNYLSSTQEYGSFYNSEKVPKIKKKSMVWVSEGTIPTERPPLVGEVIANFCG
jgi:hypothetical protein